MSLLCALCPHMGEFEGTKKSPRSGLLHREIIENESIKNQWEVPLLLIYFSIKKLLYIDLVSSRLRGLRIEHGGFFWYACLFFHTKPNRGCIYIPLEPHTYCQVCLLHCWCSSFCFCCDFWNQNLVQPRPLVYSRAFTLVCNNSFSLCFPISFLSPEICLEAGMDKRLSFSTPFTLNQYRCACYHSAYVEIGFFVLTFSYLMFFLPAFFFSFFFTKCLRL